MDSPHSDPHHVLTSLKHAVWHGDWDEAARLSFDAARQNTATDNMARNELLLALNETLAALRAGRAELDSALARVKIASRFHDESITNLP